MKIAVIGSRGIEDIDIGQYLLDAVADKADITEIVTGGARGVDACAERYAKENGITLTVFKPEYKRYSRAAPIVRNEQIVEYADLVVAIWDGKSKGTLSVIKFCKRKSKPIKLILL